MLGYMLHFLGKIRWILFVYSTKSRTFAPVKHRGVEQLVARWAHNPKVIRSSRISATTMRIKGFINHFILIFLIPIKDRKKCLRK